MKALLPLFLCFPLTDSNTSDSSSHPAPTVRAEATVAYLTHLERIHRSFWSVERPTIDFSSRSKRSIRWTARTIAFLALLSRNQHQVRRLGTSDVDADLLTFNAELLGFVGRVAAVIAQGQDTDEQARALLAEEEVMQHSWATLQHQLPQRYPSHAAAITNLIGRPSFVPERQVLSQPKFEPSGEVSLERSMACAEALIAQGELPALADWPVIFRDGIRRFCFETRLRLHLVLSVQTDGVAPCVIDALNSSVKMEAMIYALGTATYHNDEGRVAIADLADLPYLNQVTTPLNDTHLFMISGKAARTLIDDQREAEKRLWRKALQEIIYQSPQYKERAQHVFETRFQEAL